MGSCRVRVWRSYRKECAAAAGAELGIGWAVAGMDSKVEIVERNFGCMTAASSVIAAAAAGMAFVAVGFAAVAVAAFVVFELAGMALSAAGSAVVAEVVAAFAASELVGTVCFAAGSAAGVVAEFAAFELAAAAAATSVASELVVVGRDLIASVSSNMQVVLVEADNFGSPACCCLVAGVDRRDLIV